MLGSFWASPFSDPPLLPLCGLGSWTGFDCWWRVGTCLDLLCVWVKQTLRGRERSRGSKRRSWWSASTLCEVTLEIWLDGGVTPLPNSLVSVNNRR